MNTNDTQATDAAPPPRGSSAVFRKPWVRTVATLVIVTSAGATYYAFGPGAATSSSGAAGGPGGPGGPGGRKGDPTGRAVPVKMAQAKTEDIDVYLSGLGTATAASTVTVRARVEGQLMRVLFREGQMVKAGDLLAEIDPRPLQVQLTQAEGQMARDQALLANAQVDLERYLTLFAQDSVARQQLDTQQALVRQYQGVIKADQGAVDNARLQLAYTHITAPISGRLGLRQVDEGNMVRNGDANGLVVIAQIRPMTTVFSIPEVNLSAVMKRLASGDRLTVDAYDREGKLKIASGTLLTVDNLIDPATGTVKLKASFGNEDGALFPNQFVNVKLRVNTLRGATVVPAAAVLRGTPGTFVYRLQDDNTVSIRPVKLGPAQGERVAIESGLAPGDRIVVDGSDKLREGARVEAIERNADTVAGAGAAAGKGARAAAGPGGPGGPGAGSAEERQKRWAETNARIDRGEFGEEIKKLPEEARKQRMRELRRGREGGGAGGQN